MFSIHASFPVFHDIIESIFFYVCCFQYNYNLRTNLFFLDCMFVTPERRGSLEWRKLRASDAFFCQRFTVAWHAAAFQDGRQNRNQRVFEVTEIENFRVFDGAFYAKRLDHPVQLARNTGRTGVLGRNPASKQKENVRWGLLSFQRSSSDTLENLEPIDVLVVTWLSVRTLVCTPRPIPMP